jgi:hypothetical protein
MNSQQRIGLGMVALFYGELVAAPLFMLIVLLRFPGNFSVLVHQPRFTLLYLITIAAFEGLTAAITWMIFGSLLVVAWQPSEMRVNRGAAYAACLPLALLAPGLLAALLWRLHALHSAIPHITRTLFLETFFFMLVSAVVAMYRYLKMSAQAETLLASGGEFRY